MSPEEYISSARKIADAARGHPTTEAAEVVAVERPAALLLCEDTGKIRVVECDDPWSAATAMSDAVGGEVSVRGVSQAGREKVLEQLGEYHLGNGWLSAGIPAGKLRRFRSPHPPGQRPRRSHSRDP